MNKYEIVDAETGKTLGGARTLRELDAWQDSYPYHRQVGQYDDKDGVSTLFMEEYG